MQRGQSLIVPPLFDGINYVYQKVYMRAFLQSLDKKMWQAVEIGQTKPKEFKKISCTETAKEAWTILQTTYERTKAIKDSNLQRLTTSFEEIKMEEDESFDEFYAKLKDIVNLPLILEKSFLNPKL